MSNEDGSIWVTYNGELYNELELRTELEAKGHRYRTSCDTESLVHLYEEEGPDFVRRLNGMFALAIWDRRRGRLVLARDRMGQKPLYYGALPGGGLAFGSEPKAVLAHPEISRALDRDEPGALPFLRVCAGPVLDLAVAAEAARRPRVDLGTGAIRVCEVLEAAGHGVEPRASTSRTRPSGSGPSFATAVARHRRSDVPIGVFLSGGRRFLERRRRALRGRAGAERADVLDRLRGPELRRERPRPGGRPAPGDRPPRADLLGRDGL